MFKSLLRTLPTLSGNFSICCKLEDFNKISSNDYETYIRNASVLSLQDSQYNNEISINLANENHEFIISKYYKLYSNVFYKENYVYDKKNYQTYDKYQVNSNNDGRNKDYEFGCKRLNYSYNGYQFNFYAPFYIDDVNSLPEYFLISIYMTDKLIKTIKVFIDKKNSTNYLRKYLVKYCSKLDNKVIFCLPRSKQSTYFGINVKEGGFGQYIDNEFGKLYNVQHTINNFDYTICKGFERNHLIMKQIIPLSFSFNINDLFSEYEKKVFAYDKIKIIGRYVNKYGVSEDFYDFSINYTNFNCKYNKYDNGEYSLNYDYDDNNNPINVMNVKYPSLNESKYVKYRFTNKITPNYCRFKLAHSNDNDPYIINMSYAYSSINKDNIKYGEFPTIFKDIFPVSIVRNNNLILPIGNNINTYENYDSSNYLKYKKLMTNFYSSWFNVLKDNTTIFDYIYNWSDVKNKYSYFNGVLYNFKNEDIDKFSLFINPIINYISNENVKENILNAIYVFDTERKDLNKSSFIRLNNISYNKNYDQNVINRFFEYTRYIDYVALNKNMIKDPNGNYILINDYYDRNLYYKVSDVKQIINSLNNDENNLSELFDNYIISNKIIGYIYLNVNSLNNIFDNNNELIFDDLSNIYFTSKENKDKTSLNLIIDKIKYNHNYYSSVLLYEKSELLESTSLLNFLNKKVQNINFNNIISYNYIPCSLNKDNDIIKDYYVTNKKYIDNNIYVDSYNINNLIYQYNQHNNKEIKLINTKDYEIETMYSEFFNLDHIKQYSEKLYKEYDDINITIKNKQQYLSIINNIFVKERIWIKENNKLIYKDIYTTLSKYLMNINKINSNNKNNSQKGKYKYLNTLFIVNTVYNDGKEYLKNDSIYDDSIYDLYEKQYYKNANDIFMKICSKYKNENNKFVLKLDENNSIELTLVFRKKFIKLNDSLKELIENNNYLYLYTINYDLENNDNWLNESYLNNKKNNYDNVEDINDEDINDEDINDEDINDEDINNEDINDEDINDEDINDKFNNYYYVEDIDKFISPLFKSIYINEQDINLVNDLITKNKIIDNKFNTNVNNVFMYIDDNFKQNNENLNIDFYSIYETNIISYKKLNEDLYDTNKYELIESSSNLNILKNLKTNIKYGFFIIDFNFDNTNNSLNINNQYNISTSFETINGNDISNKKYIDSVFNIINPFFKENIFKTFIIDNNNYIKFPNEFDLSILYNSIKLNKDEVYKYEMLKESDDDQLYENIIKFEKPKKIKLLRYFNYIEPLLLKTNRIKDLWETKFIENDNYSEKYNILYKSNVNINKYNGIHLCYEYDDTNKKEIIYDKINQYEYKHYNDNSFYNLQEEIIITINKLVEYNDIINIYQTEERTFEEFKKYINNINKNIDDLNIILFLYNKYKVSYSSEQVKLDSSKSKKLYKISYKFNLK